MTYHYFLAACAGSEGLAQRGWPMELRKRHRSLWIDLSTPFPSNECILDRRSNAPVTLACFSFSCHNILVVCSLSVVMLDVVSPNKCGACGSTLLVYYAVVASILRPLWMEACAAQDLAMR